MKIRLVWGWVILGFAGTLAWGGETVSLREGFANPPVEARPHVWWHWNDDEINKKAMTADLESMKKVGIGGAYIFFLCGPGEGMGLTPERLELYRYAAEEAKRLGLELGMHNCPGWSSSGGPWISPEDSMKCLVATESVVEGGKTISLTLPRGTTRKGFYRDVAVVAFPVDSLPPDPEIFMDGKKIDALPLAVPVDEEGQKAVVECRFATPIEARYLQLTFPQTQLYANAQIEARDASGTFQPVGTLKCTNFVDSGAGKVLRLGNVGQTVKSDCFRLNFAFLPRPPYVGKHKPILGKIRFYRNSMIEAFDMKNASLTSFGFRVPADPSEQGIDPADVLDLTARMDADGWLKWDAPEGTFIVLRIGCTTTGKSCAPAHPKMSGLECDKLSKRGVEAHWKGMMEPVLEQMKAFGSLRVALIDSYEVGGQNWTFDFDKDFLARRGYTMRPWFPALFGYTVGTSLDSARFLYDFQRTVADSFARNYYDHFSALCAEKGLTASCEAYGGPFDNLQCANHTPFAVSEFWVEGTLASRFSSSAAHINGRAVNGAESFTTGPVGGRWQQEPAGLKAQGDTVWLEGVNQFILHSFVHQPYLNVRPGRTLGPHGTQFGRNNTWWNDSVGWMHYMARAQFLLQSGIPTAEVLILSGESRPNQLGIRREISRAGYDYDFCDPETFRDRVFVKEGKIYIRGASQAYQAFALGNDPNLSLGTLKKVKTLLDAGAVVVGLRPTYSPSLADKPAEKEYATLAETLWTPGRYPHLYPNGNIVEALKKEGILPNFRSPCATLGSVCRQTPTERIYFVCNESDQPVSTLALFRATGKAVEFWNPLDGSITACPVWSESARGQTQVPLTLDAHGSIFVVFTDLPNVKPATRAVEIVAGTVPRKATPYVLEILEAKYRLKGAAEGGVDVTDTVRGLQSPIGLDFLVETAAFQIPDPFRNQFKELFLRYRLNGEEKSEIFQEHKPLCLRVPGNLTIREAKYRLRDQKETAMDVTEIVRRQQTPFGLDFVVNNALFHAEGFGPNQYKELYLRYAIGDREGELVAPEHLPFRLEVPAQMEPYVANLFVHDGKTFARFDLPGKIAVKTDSGAILSARTTEPPASLSLDTDWTVEFAKDLGAPETPVRFDKLISWTERPEFGVKYFSGSAVYRKTLTIPEDFIAKGRQVTLHLGTVKNLARIAVNGRPVSLVWTPAFEADVTRFLRPGENTLEITVTNLWVNRMIGDAFHPSAQASGRPQWVREDRPNSGDGCYTWSSWKGWTKDDAPLPSGLLGPVTLLSRPVVELR
ncbi:MAG: glycosyl hydrolase [Planctomycetia bacterium]|nr:glycosyl hydrolase [Planctomycetia bacterium]